MTRSGSRAVGAGSAAVRAKNSWRKAQVTGKAMETAAPWKNRGKTNCMFSHRFPTALGKLGKNNCAEFSTVPPRRESRVFF